jgi:uncharacterized membrane protein YfcA
MIEPASLASVLLVLIIVAAGSAIQVAVGMGLNLFAVPLLMLIDPAYGPAPVLVASLVLSVLALWRVPAKVDGRELGLIGAGLLGGGAIAAWVIASIDTASFARVLGALIVVAVVLVLSGRSVAIGAGSLTAAGAAAGFMGTIAGIHAPPIALLYSREPPMRLRGALLTMIIIGNIVSLAALAAVGRFGAREITQAGLLLPGVAVGLATAPIVARSLDAKRTRWAVLAIAGLSGLALVLR